MKTLLIITLSPASTALVQRNLSRRRRLDPWVLAAFLCLIASYTFAADKTWIGGSGDWHDGNMWDPAGVPTSGDTASVNNGNVTVTQAVTVAGLALTNTTINNTATMMVTNFTAHSGLLTGDGLFVAAAGGTMTLPDNYPQVNGKTLRLEGNTLVQGGSGGLYLFPGAVVQNLGLLELQDDSDRVLLSWGGEGSGNYLFNQGTLRKSAGTEISVFQLGAVVTNAGTVEVLTGALRFGDVFVQTGGETVLGGTGIYLDRRSSILGGVLRGNGTVFGTLTNAGTISPGASAGAMNILRHQFVLAGDYVQTAAGTLNIELGGLTPTNQHEC